MNKEEQRKVKDDTTKTALVLLRLTEREAITRRVEIPNNERFDAIRDYINTINNTLTDLRSKLEANEDSARWMEKHMLGKGVIDSELSPSIDNEDEESKYTGISQTKNKIPRLSEQGKKYCRIAEKCSRIMEQKNISVKDADTLVRGINELVGSPILEAATESATLYLDKKERTLFISWATELGDKIKNEPYVKLRSIISQMYGNGATWLIDGTFENDKNHRIAMDLNSPSDFIYFAKYISSLSPQEPGWWDESYPAIVKQISRSLLEGNLPETECIEEMNLLNAYAGLQEPSKTAKECLDAVNNIEKKSGAVRTIHNFTNGYENEYPISGIGHILNSKRYAKGPDAPYKKIVSSINTAHSLYSGRQAIQNLLLAGARVLCGEDPQEGRETGGASWFIKNNLSNVVPLNLRGIAGRDFTSLCITWFSVDSHLSRLKSAPVEFLSEKHEMALKTKKEIESSKKVLERLTVALNNIYSEIKNSYVEDLEKQLSDKHLSPKEFISLESSAAPNCGSDSIPFGVAKECMIKVLKHLKEGNRTKAENDELEKHIINVMKKDSSEQWKEMFTRFTEVCGFKLSRYPVYVRDDGKAVEFEQKSVNDAYTWFETLIESITKKNDKNLSIMMNFLDGYSVWEDSISKAILEQESIRKNYEIDRAKQWIDVLGESIKALTTPVKGCEGLTYSEATSIAARESNVMLLALLTDCVLRRAGRIIKDQELQGRTNIITAEYFDSLIDRFMKIAEGKKDDSKPIERIGVEDYASALILEPALKEYLSRILTQTERNFDKTLKPEFKELNFEEEYKPSVYRPSTLSFLRSGGLLDFGSEVIFADERIKNLSKAASLLSTAERMPSNTEEEEQNKKHVLDYAYGIAEKDLYENILATLNSEETSIFKAPMDGALQKNKIEEVLELWKRSLNAMEKGNMSSSVKDIEDAKNLIEEVGKNNPFFPKDEAIKLLNSYDEKTEEFLTVEKWASPDSRYNEQWGDGTDDAKLRESIRYLKKIKEEVDAKGLKASRLEALKITDLQRSVRLASVIACSITDIFSPASGIVLEKGIKDGASAMEYVSKIEIAKEKTQRKFMDELNNKAIKIVAEMGSKLPATADIGNWEPSFKGEENTFVGLCLRNNNEYPYSYGIYEGKTGFVDLLSKLKLWTRVTNNKDWTDLMNALKGELPKEILNEDFSDAEMARLFKSNNKSDRSSTQNSSFKEKSETKIEKGLISFQNTIYAKEARRLAEIVRP